MRVRVTVPAGVFGGQQVRVKTGSASMQVTVPSGLTAGQKFDLTLPATHAGQPAGTASVGTCGSDWENERAPAMSPLTPVRWVAPLQRAEMAARPEAGHIPADLPADTISTIVTPTAAPPVAPPVKQTMRVVTVPAGVFGGQPLRVQTPLGLLQVTVPLGFTAGQQFGVLPPAGREWPTVRVAWTAGSSGGSYPENGRVPTTPPLTPLDRAVIPTGRVAADWACSATDTIPTIATLPKASTTPAKRPRNDASAVPVQRPTLTHKPQRRDQQQQPVHAWPPLFLPPAPVPSALPPAPLDAGRPPPTLQTLPSPGSARSTTLVLTELEAAATAAAVAAEAVAEAASTPRIEMILHAFAASDERFQQRAARGETIRRERGALTAWAHALYALPRLGLPATPATEAACRVALGMLLCDIEASDKRILQAVARGEEGAELGALVAWKADFEAAAATDFAAPPPAERLPSGAPAPTGSAAPSGTNPETPPPPSLALPTAGAAAPPGAPIAAQGLDALRAVAETMAKAMSRVEEALHRTSAAYATGGGPSVAAAEQIDRWIYK